MQCSHNFFGFSSLSNKNKNKKDIKYVKFIYHRKNSMGTTLRVTYKIKEANKTIM